MAIRLRIEESAAKCLMPMIQKWTRRNGYTRMKTFIHYHWDYTEILIEGELPFGWQEKLCVYADKDLEELPRCNQGKGHKKKSFY